MIEHEMGAILTGLNRICRECGLDDDVNHEEDKPDYVRENSKDRDRYQQDE